MVGDVTVNFAVDGSGEASFKMDVGQTIEWMKAKAAEELKLEGAPAPLLVLPSF